MQIGMYKRNMSLLWDNEKDRDVQMAIKEARYKKNGISRIVIRIQSKKPTYSTKLLIQWFMNQRFSCGEQFTHALLPNGRVKLVSRKLPYKFRHWIPTLILLWDGDTHYLSPGVHVENMRLGTSELKSLYNELAQEWKYEPEPIKLAKSTYSTDFTMFTALMNAYEVDELSADLIDIYILNKIPITRLPQDELIYAWFVQLGIAPIASSLDPNNPTPSIFDEERVTYIGKEALLDDEEYLEN